MDKKIPWPSLKVLVANSTRELVAVTCLMIVNRRARTLHPKKMVAQADFVKPN